MIHTRHISQQISQLLTLQEPITDIILFSIIHILTYSNCEILCVYSNDYVPPETRGCYLLGGLVWLVCGGLCVTKGGGARSCCFSCNFLIWACLPVMKAQCSLAVDQILGVCIFTSFAILTFAIL